MTETTVHVRSSAAGEIAPDAAPAVDLSVVIPAYNEAASLTELVEAITEALAGSGLSYDVWIVDDGSDDGTFAVIERLAQQHAELHGLCMGRNFGKAAALAAGFAHARGAVIVTMDADLQDDPAEIQRLTAKIDEGFDLVSGWKQDRKDSFVKNQTSKLFNWATGRMCGLRLHDFNCGLKAYRREVTHSLRLYGEMHRFTPALAHLSGYAVTELPVCHHARKHGHTKYGLDRFLNGFLDLLTVYFLYARGSSPLHFFGRVGTVLGVVGGGISFYFLLQWLLGHGLRVRPILVLGLIMIVMAVQFVSLGLIAELVVAGRHPEREYRVRDSV